MALKLSALLGAISFGFPLLAQNVCPPSSQKTICLMPNLFGSPSGGGLILPNPTHSAHFLDESGSTLPVIGPLNNAIGTQLNLLPTVSPASGIVFTFDPSTSLLKQLEQSFGPIYSERGETLGRHKVLVGFSFQNFIFDKIDGQDLGTLPAVFRHEDVPNPPAPQFLKDLITTVNSIHLRVSQYTTYATVGITSRLDASIAIPVLSTKLGVGSFATIRYNAPNDPAGPVHYFAGGGATATFSNTTTQTGIGDVVLRVKGTVLRGERGALALGADVRFPTGDELNFLGSGTAGFKPFIAASMSIGRFSPHANFGYQLNGDSILAGNILTGQKSRLPNSVLYSVGADVAVHRRVTAAFDYVGQEVVKAQRLQLSNSFTNTAGTFTGIQTYADTFNLSSMATGLKISLPHRLLLTGNLLFRVNDAGLRAKIVPLVSLSHVF